MGNRAVIAFGDSPSDLGIYLHWNGGPESVDAFLEAGKKFKIASNPSYTVAHLAQIIGNFFGGTNSIGVGKLQNLDQDNGDNGVYVVDAKLNITSRKHVPSSAVGRGYNEESFVKVLNEVMRVNRSIFAPVDEEVTT